MKKCEIYLTDNDYETLKEIFVNEPDFKPMCKQDFLIVRLLKQIEQNSEHYEDEEDRGE